MSHPILFILTIDGPEKFKFDESSGDYDWRRIRKTSAQSINLKLALNHGVNNSNIMVEQLWAIGEHGFNMRPGATAGAQAAAKMRLDKFIADFRLKQHRRQRGASLASLSLKII